MCHVWRRIEVCTGFWWGNLRVRAHLVDTDVDERITLKWVFKKMDEGVDWIGLDQDRNSWRALVKVVSNHRFL